MTIQMIYLFVLCDPEMTDRYIKQEYEHFCRYCLHFNKNLPIELIVGFFVTTVVGRWWDQFCLIPYIDELAMKIVNFLPNMV